ncbi:MAG: ParB/RepB/Spo0J family partition protein [candidate division KSB1 bacterium]|nr:ParB/RepB/Spo0J family partition protein [candidate division KSB1 bacterium]MDZ7335656.1 ParB/RepB/Spo0J family partition protein [candidate division KSB1 bacterium]MDZ7357725.1 ParB/RepB/Spo0J family partition protein [candidate division KSB1 bacterium]MDZ7376777.1 ParB/RepB/Spo0J family partition protein [candidate division KSB1 bacterium]MDZ7402033.1 ParB/RepB/Spo0J family partition protein [candidate division KSB1 bacterium]
MASKRLGRGLRALIPDIPEEESEERISSIREIEVHKIKPNPFQPRENFDEAALEELKNSIAEKGIIQPITVRRVDDGYELIAGERRLRAVTALNIESIPAYVLEVRSDEEMLELSLIENIQREDLNPIDIARAYNKLLVDCNLTQEAVAKRVGKERSTVANFLRLLKLPPMIQESLRTGQLDMGHARALITIEDEQLQKSIWEKIIKDHLSVRDVERLVRQAAKKRTTPEGDQPTKSLFVLEMEERLRNKFGTQVKINLKKKGGNIEIEFYSDEELERLLEILQQ